MSLLEDLTEYGKTMTYPDPIGDGIDCAFVDDYIVDTSRWSIIHEAIYLRKTIVNHNPLEFEDEYVMMVYREPATESQDWGDEGEPELYHVRPVEETVIRFVRK